MKSLSLLDSLRFALPDGSEGVLPSWMRLDGRFGAVPTSGEARPRWSLQDDGLEGRLLIPGVSPTDVTVSAQGRVLSVSLTHASAKASWSWTIAEDFDLSQVTARVSRGVLSLSIPRVPADPVVPIAVIDVDSLVHQAMGPSAPTAPEGTEPSSPPTSL